MWDEPRSSENQNRIVHHGCERIAMRSQRATAGTSARHARGAQIVADDLLCEQRLSPKDILEPALGIQNELRVSGIVRYQVLFTVALRLLLEPLQVSKGAEVPSGAVAHQDFVRALHLPSAADTGQWRASPEGIACSGIVGDAMDTMGITSLRLIGAQSADVWPRCRT